MTTISFYARGDASTANNPSLNVENPSQQPTVLITFNSGPTGDIILDANGGDVDPDTTVTIDGVTYDFVLEQTGDLPIGNNKVPDALEGLQVTVISVVIDGTVERFFFVTDGSGTMTLMNQFGNGAIPLDNVNTSPTTVFICFCGGTDILTPGGYRKVEDLRAGDLVLNDAGDAVPVLWIGQSRATREDMRREPERRPIRIPAHMMGQGVPHSDLEVSAQHRIVLQDALTELYFGEDRVMVRAAHLVGRGAEWIEPSAGVRYYHILLERHEIVVANGLMTESFQPSRRSVSGIATAMRLSLYRTLPSSVLRAFLERPDALPTLRQHEASVLGARLFPRKSCGSLPHRKLAIAA